ncbi:MAG: substrate-binding domain-containing protein [Chlamydiae bacterium]|nr:substrate-binding domain-containing protein [Chlamydiota bacterium]MBI3266791.1 substrate-binding domain-containing protein [Chlamydiota bacterium]
MKRVLSILLVMAGLLAASGVYAKEIAVIVNKENGTSNLSMSELSRIYEGKMTSWSNGSRMMVINRPTASPIRSAFYRTVLGVEAGKQFFQPGSPVPFKTMIQESDTATKRMVSQMPNAVGYIYVDALDDTVKAVSIDGASLTPDDISSGRYALKE